MQAPHALPDYEIIEFLLFAANARQDVKPLAKILHHTFGSLAGVLAASPSSLADAGVTHAQLAYFTAVREAALRMLKSSVLTKPVMDHWEALVGYCSAQMGQLTIEQFRVLYLDTKNRMIADECLGMGTTNEVPVYPRQIVKRALELDSSAVILVHNHPSGDPMPSQADKDMTFQIVRACHAVGIMVHDHLVISKTGHYSFCHHGILPAAE